MLDILKKTYLAGAGLAHKTWEEVEALSKEVAKKAKMSESEGSRFLKDMRKRYDETQKKTGAYIEKVVRDVLKKMDVATASDINALKKEIRQLKKATGSSAAKKSSRSTAAKKRSSTAAKKRPAKAPKRRQAADKKTTSRAKAKPKTRAHTAKVKK